MLYSIPINGDMLYFMGEIDESLYTRIEALLAEITVDADDTDYMKFSKVFESLAKERFNIELKRIKISRVLRRRENNERLC